MIGEKTAPAVIGVGRLSPLLLDGLRSYRLVEAPGDLAWTDEVASVAAQTRAIVAGGSQPLPTDWLDRFERLELIAVHGAGTDGIDLAAARARGIAVTNTPDVLTDDVAEFAIGLLLAVLRRIPGNDRLVRDGAWATGNMPPLGLRLAGRHVGLLGMGRIGQAIARRLAGFEVTISYAAHRTRADLPYRRHADPVALAREANILLITVPGGASTAGLVDARVLAALGPAGILVNVARGSVVDEPALLRALATGGILAAGLDVFAQEPVSAARFAAFDNVVLQPHQGSATHEARRAMADLVLANLAAWFAERRLISSAGGRRRTIGCRIVSLHAHSEMVARQNRFMTGGEPSKARPCEDTPVPIRRKPQT